MLAHAARREGIGAPPLPKIDPWSNSRVSDTSVSLPWGHEVRQGAEHHSRWSICAWLTRPGDAGYDARGARRWFPSQGDFGTR
jgi:hypothetical protein